MTLKQSINVLLIALFVWGFQSSTIHFQHHEIEEVVECNACHVAEHIDLVHHNIPLPIIQENITVKLRNNIKNVKVNLAFDYVDVPHLKYLNILPEKDYTLGTPPLGFNATAPPHLCLHS